MALKAGRWLPFAILMASPPAGAWSINTHLYSAAVIVEDLADDGMVQLQVLERQPDGTVTRTPLAPIAVPTARRAAIQAHPECLYAGSCGPDGYPDIYVGQSIIHPYEAGQEWRAIDWARHVDRFARNYASGDRRQMAVAYAGGFLIHYAGDAFGHTWVNSYSGGCWDWGNLDLVSKHVAIESYVNSKLPWAGPPRPDVDPSFLRDCLMLDDDIQPSLVHSGFLQAIVDYRRGLQDAIDECNDQIDDVTGWLTGAGATAYILKPYLVALRNDADRALYEWGETGSRAMREMADGHPTRIVSVINEWSGEWLPNLVIGLPSSVEELLGKLGAPMDWISMPIGEAMDRLVDWVWDHAIRGPFEEALNAEVFLNATCPEELRALINEDLHLTENGQINPDEFAALHDTIVLGKLALLDETGIQALAEQLGVTITTYGDDDNLLWSCIDSLDASNQLGLAPKFRLLESQELTAGAFRRLFLNEAYQQATSRIDPTHLLCTVVPGSRQVWFGTPLADPGTDQLTAKGYLIEHAEGASQPKLAPVWEQAVNTAGAVGRDAELVRDHWAAPYDGTYWFHLTTALPAAGTGDRVEDEGLDVCVPVKMATTNPGEGPDVAALLAQMDAAAQVAIAMAEMMQQAGQPGADPNAIRAAWQQARQQLLDLPNQDPGTGPDVNVDDPLVIPPDTFQMIRDGLAQAGAAGGAGGGAAGAEDAQASGGLLLGELRDAAGEPVAGASVTVLEATLYQQLKAATGKVQLRLDQLWPARYGLGRTNSAGQFVVMGLREGPCRLTASAAGQPRLIADVTINYGGKFGQQLAPLSFPAEAAAAPPPTTTAADGGAAAGSPPPGQDPVNPRFVLEPRDPGQPRQRLISWRGAAPDGSVTTTVVLRPLSGYQGQVELTVEGLPAGVTATCDPNPVNLSALQEVKIRFTATPEADDRAPVTIRATAGDLVAELPLQVALARGRVVTDPEVIEVRRGASTPVRVVWTGGGQVARLRCGPLPAGLTVKAVTAQWHPLAEPLSLAGLTVNRAIATAAKLREAEPKLPAPGPERPLIKDADLAQAPTLAPQRGLVLAPEGWVDLVVGAAAGTPPGVATIPLHCRLGQVELTLPPVAVTVTR